MERNLLYQDRNKQILAKSKNRGREMPSFTAFLSLNFPMKPGFHMNTKSIRFLVSRDSLRKYDMEK